MDTGWVSPAGDYVDSFEKLIRNQVGSRAAVATVNGTTALHVLITAIGVEPGDEIIMPALTFVATANAVAHAAATPHFADIERSTMGLDPANLDAYLTKVAEVRNQACFNRETGARIRAIVAVHVFGHPCDLDGLAAVARRFNLVLLEDAAESLGSDFCGKPTGAIARAGILSFNGNKTITTGGGGAVVTNDTALGNRIRHLATTAKKPHAWLYEHDAVGFNYRMPNINAALGCAQMERLDRFIEEKRRLADWYRKRLQLVRGVEFVDETPGNRSNFWLNAILLEDEAQRDQLLEQAHALDINLRPAWQAMHHLPMYAKCPRSDLSVTEDICKRLLNLPSGVETAREVASQHSDARPF